MALDETVKRLRAARDVSAALESPRLAVTLSDLDEVLDAADLLCRLRELPSAKPERAERADVATLERVRERLRGLYDETSPHNATASRMLFVIDDMLTEARAQPAAVSEPSFYPFGTAVRVPRVDLGNVSLEAAAEGEWTGGDPIAAAIVARAKQAEAQAHETADLLVAMQRRAEQAEADLARERASHERLIDVIAQETNAAGISDTMTPEERVSAVCKALAREREAHEATRRRFAPDQKLATMTVREACRRRQPIDASEAQAVEHCITITEQERDAARAEVERLKAAIANAMQALGLVALSPIESISAIGRELDDARAEVERLKADLTRAVTAPCDACGHGKSADWKALEAEVERLRAAAEPVRWDDVEGLCKVAWYATEVMASWEMLSDREREERRTEMRAVLSALARALLTEGALTVAKAAMHEAVKAECARRRHIDDPEAVGVWDAFVIAAGMRAALAHAGANVEAEPVAEGRACPWDDRRDNIRAAIRMVHQANEPHSSAIHGVTIALEQLALAVDEVRRLGGGGR